MVIVQPLKYKKIATNNENFISKAFLCLHTSKSLSKDRGKFILKPRIKAKRELMSDIKAIQGQHISPISIRSKPLQLRELIKGAIVSDEEEKEPPRNLKKIIIVQPHVLEKEESNEDIPIWGDINSKLSPIYQTVESKYEDNKTPRTASLKVEKRKRLNSVSRHKHNNHHYIY